MNPWEFARGNGGLALVVLAIVSPVLLVALPVLFVWYVVRPTIKAGWRHPATTAVLCVYVVLAVVLGVLEAAGFLLGLALALGLELLAWRVLEPDGFARWVSGPVRVYRRRFSYRRRWNDLMIGLGLACSFTTPSRRGPVRSTVVPGLVSVSCGAWMDRIVVRPVVGQDFEVFEKTTPAMAVHLGSRSVRALAHGNGLVCFEIARGDRHSPPVPALPVPAAVDLSCLPVGVREDGGPWNLVLTGGSHTFIGGVTMAGKSSVVWSLLRALAPAVHEGWVQLWGVDPKIMEFTYGPTLFHRLETSRNPDGIIKLFEDAVALMHERADRYAGTARTHVPSVDEPFVVVLVDELAFLTAWGGPKAQRDRISQLLSILCTQGRAVGFVVVAAAQDVRKDVVSMRNLFPVKIALRLDEPSQVDMLLGDGARDQGALCDRISDRLPGVGYVKVDGHREPLRVRAAYVSDTDIRHLAATYPAPAHNPRLTLVQDDDLDGERGAA